MMTPQSDNSERVAIAEDEAADWIVRLSGTTTSDEDVVAWRRWLAQSEINQRAYVRMEEVWRLSGYMDQPPWPTDAELSQDAYAGDRPVEEWHHAEILTATIATTSSKRRWRPQRIQWMAATLAAVAIVAAGWQFRQIEWQDTPGQLAVFETAAAENRDVTLADGSQVSLGGQSLISVSYSDTQRNVVLERGEAFFDVAKNPRRPFVVHAGAKSIRAVGTAFNVAKYDDQVTVTVTEGRVIVAAPSIATLASRSMVDSPSLVAGQEVRYDANTAELPVREVDTGITIAWRDGTLKYMAEPLSSVVQDVNRYSAGSVITIDADVGELSFTGTVFQNAVDDWLSSLEQAFPVDVETEANGDVRIRAR